MFETTRKMIVIGVAGAVALAGPSLAQQPGEPALRVSYAADASMTCEQLMQEIARMEEIAGISTQNAANAQSQGQMAETASGMAVNAALYSGALGRVPGLGMFANAAGAAARRNAEARARAEAERVQVAEQRRTLLTGIYQGRQCGMPTPAPAPAAAAAAVEAAVEAATQAAPPPSTPPSA